MSERENQPKKKSLIEEAYEMTENKWNHILMRDLNHAILCRLRPEKNNRRYWFLSEAKDESRQLEVIHLNILVEMVNEENLNTLAKELEQRKPSQYYSIQPLYEPQNEDEDPKLMDIEMDSETHIVLSKDSFLFKLSTEV